MRSPYWLVLSVCWVFSGSVSAGSLSFSSPTYTVSEHSPTLTVSVIRTGSTSATASVTVISTPGTAGADDFNAVSQALTWGVADAGIKTLTITLKDDSLFEGTEIFSLKFTSAVGDGTGGDAIVNITDYEEGKLQFSSASFSGQEDSLQANVTVTRVSGVAGPATVKLKTVEVTPPPDKATKDLDYTAVDTTLSFEDGESSKTFAIPLKNDNVAEFSEFLQATLSTPSGSTLGAITTSNIEIKDTDSDFTSTLKLLTKNVANITQSQLVDLTQNSLLDSTKKVLDLVNTIPILTLTGITAKQDTDGLMTIDVETDRVYLRPVYIKRAASSATPVINVRDDINSTFTTSQGWTLEAQPALAAKGLTVLQKALAAIFLPDLVITDTGNITIQADQGAPPFERDASNNVIVNYKFYDRWNLRPSMISTLTTATKEGYSLAPHPLDPKEVVVSVVYLDSAKYRRQILSSAPINGPELIQELESNGVNRCAVILVGVCKVSVNNPKQLNSGIVTLDIPYTPPEGSLQTIKLTIFADYKIRKVPNFTLSMVGFRETIDLNQDGYGDYKMVYANGEEQYFFYVSSYIKD